MKTLLVAAMLNAAVTQGNIGQTICKPGWTDTIRPPTSYTSRLKRNAIPAGAHLRDWEEDHFIPLELGGAPRALVNLWPQPWQGKCGAHAKDQDETQLNRKVCAGRMTLAAAQKAMADKWGPCRG